MSSKCVNMNVGTLWRRGTCGDKLTGKVGPTVRCSLSLPFSSPPPLLTLQPHLILGCKDGLTGVASWLEGKAGSISLCPQTLCPSVKCEGTGV